MMEHIIEFLRSMDEPEMADEVANDPTEFGCACDLSVGYLCGPCHADKQQESIDNLKAQLESAQKSSAHVWKQHEELFDALARFLDADMALDRLDVDRAKKYLKQRHELSLAVLDCGYCLRCRDFICHCGEDV